MMRQTMGEDFTRLTSGEQLGEAAATPVEPAEAVLEEPPEHPALRARVIRPARMPAPAPEAEAAADDDEAPDDAAAPVPPRPLTPAEAGAFYYEEDEPDEPGDPDDEDATTTSAAGVVPPIVP